MLCPCPCLRSTAKQRCIVRQGESIHVERREMTLANAGDKYELGPAQLLQSSAPRSWVGMSAEFRLHVSGRADAFVQPVTEISMVLRGEGLVRRRDSGETHTTHAAPGVIWLCSAGQRIDWLEMERGALEILHLYLRPDALLEFSSERGLQHALQSMRYTVGDPLLE